MDDDGTPDPAREPLGPSQPPMLEDLRSRLPDLLTQAAFVFLAVFLALAAEEWRSDRDRQALADRALDGILREIDANRRQLKKDQTQLEDLEQLKRAESEETGDRTAINYQFALISDAAWDAARMSQAVHTMDLELMTQLSAVYNFQAIFVAAQDDLMANLTTYPILRPKSPETADQTLRVLLRNTISYRQILLQVYDGFQSEHAH